MLRKPRAFSKTGCLATWCLNSMFSWINCRLRLTGKWIGGDYRSPGLSVRHKKSRRPKSGGVRSRTLLRAFGESCSAGKNSGSMKIFSRWEDIPCRQRDSPHDCARPSTWTSRCAGCSRRRRLPGLLNISRRSKGQNLLSPLARSHRCFDLEDFRFR